MFVARISPQFGETSVIELTCHFFANHDFVARIVLITLLPV